MCCKFILSWLFIPFFLLGCSTSQQHKKADMQVYQILEKAEKYVFGKSEEFTINTKYSSKKNY